MKKPNFQEAQWLKRIAQSPLMVTKRQDEEPFYCLQNGNSIPAKTAISLIKNGWVKGQRDGLFDDPQTYTALTPTGHYK